MICLSNFTELKRLRQTVEWELMFRSQVQDYHRAIRMGKLLIWIDNKLWAFPSENVNTHIRPMILMKCRFQQKHSLYKLTGKS